MLFGLNKMHTFLEKVEYVDPEITSAWTKETCSQFVFSGKIGCDLVIFKSKERTENIDPSKKGFAGQMFGIGRHFLRGIKIDAKTSLKPKLTYSLD